MNIGFYGAARTVTGSKHIVTLNNGTKILLDCGLFQGMGSNTQTLNESFGFNAADISVVVLSHAHIDHTGLLPKLMKEGFIGKIYCTKATKELTEILLHDSACIQVFETDKINHERAQHNLDPYKPLYTMEDVNNVMAMFECIEFGMDTSIYKDVDVLFNHTGHLIGSASVHLTIKEDNKITRITFSGDIGRYRSMLMKAPECFPQSDIIIMESTYGDTHRGISTRSLEDIEKHIKKTCIEKQGKLIIPAFSVGRTQEILYLLNQLELEKRLPDIEYFVDSPLSMRATQVIKTFPEEFNDHLQQVLVTDDDPFDFKGLHYTETAEESSKLENYNKPCVIISASGTADAGRVRHHIFNGIDKAENTVLLVGYCEAKSLGGQLLSGIKEVELMGNTCSVNAEIDKIGSMSAHGDCDDLLRWLECQDAEKVKQIFLVHGEYKTQQHFKDKLSLRGFENVCIPKQGEVIGI